MKARLLTLLTILTASFLTPVTAPAKNDKSQGNGPPFTPPGPPPFTPPGPPPWVVVSPELPKAKNNNGHGNNLDGVDVSNPGKSKQGEDSDPSVDDERRFYPI